MFLVLTAVIAVSAAQAPSAADTESAHLVDHDPDEGSYSSLELGIGAATALGVDALCFGLVYLSINSVNGGGLAGAFVIVFAVGLAILADLGLAPVLTPVLENAAAPKNKSGSLGRAIGLSFLVEGATLLLELIATAAIGPQSDPTLGQAVVATIWLGGRDLAMPAVASMGLHWSSGPDAEELPARAPPMAPSNPAMPLTPPPPPSLWVPLFVTRF